MSSVRRYPTRIWALPHPATPRLETASAKQPPTGASWQVKADRRRARAVSREPSSYACREWLGNYRRGLRCRRGGRLSSAGVTSRAVPSMLGCNLASKSLSSRSTSSGDRALVFWSAGSDPNKFNMRVLPRWTNAASLTLSLSALIARLRMPCNTKSVVKDGARTVSLSLSTRKALSFPCTFGRWNTSCARCHICASAMPEQS